MYNLSSEDDVVVKRLIGGKHENIKLVKIVAEPSSASNPDSTKVLRFYLEKDGCVANHTEWPLKEDDPKRTNKVKWMGQRIFHILEAFVPKSKLNFGKVGPWDEYCDKVIELAGEAYKDQLFRGKLVYNDSGFTTFPYFVNSPFFTNMKDIDTIVITKYDNVTPPIPDDDVADDIKEEVKKDVF